MVIVIAVRFPIPNGSEFEGPVVMRTICLCLALSTLAAVGQKPGHSGSSGPAIRLASGIIAGK
jgi:hypothetical protein